MFIEKLIEYGYPVGGLEPRKHMLLKAWSKAMESRQTNLCEGTVESLLQFHRLSHEEEQALERQLFGESITNIVWGFDGKYRMSVDGEVLFERGRRKKKQAARKKQTANSGQPAKSQSPAKEPLNIPDGFLGIKRVEVEIPDEYSNIFDKNPQRWKQEFMGNTKQRNLKGGQTAENVELLRAAYGDEVDVASGEIWSRLGSPQVQGNFPTDRALSILLGVGGEIGQHLRECYSVSPEAVTSMTLKGTGGSIRPLHLIPVINNLKQNLGSFIALTLAVAVQKGDLTNFVAEAGQRPNESDVIVKTLSENTPLVLAAQKKGVSLKPGDYIMISAKADHR